MLNYLIERFDSVGIEERKAPKVGYRLHTKPTPGLKRLYQISFPPVRLVCACVRHRCAANQTSASFSATFALNVFLTSLSSCKAPWPSLGKSPITHNLSHYGRWDILFLSRVSHHSNYSVLSTKDTSRIYSIPTPPCLFCFGPRAGAHSTNLFWYLICCVGTFHTASFRSWCALHTRTTRCSDRWLANIFNY